jgi:hypothetical protein
MIGTNWDITEGISETSKPLSLLFGETTPPSKPPEMFPERKQTRAHAMKSRSSKIIRANHQPIPKSMANFS